MATVASEIPGASRLEEVRGAGYPAPGADPKEVVSYVYRLLADGDADALARYRRATHNLLFSDGRQWIDWSKRDKAWRDAPVPEGRVRVTMNYIRPILRSRVQRLLSSELSWRVRPKSNAHEDQDRATVGGNLIQSRWSATDMEAKVRYALWLAFNCGIAYLKPFWDPDLGPLTAARLVLPHPVSGIPVEYPVNAAGEPLMDEMGDPLEDSPEAFRYRPGDTNTAVRSIFNVRVNPDAYGLDPAEGFRWLIDMEVVPISVVKERYGDAARNVQTVEGIQALRQYEGLIRSVAQRAGFSVAGNDLLVGRDGQKIPDKELTLIIEYWEAPSDSLPGGRLIVVGGQERLYDGDLPQGFVPHVEIYDERRPFDAYGRPCVDDLIDPQKVINRQWGAILEEMGLSGVGQWIMFDIPGLSEQITNLSGAHIKVPIQSALANRSIGELVQRVPPGRVDPDRWRLIQEAKSTMFDIGAFHEIQRGQVPPGVDSGIAVQLLQEAENGQLHDAVRTLRRSLVRWARHTLRIARWGYGDYEERWIPVDRPDLGYLVESVRGSDLPDPETIDIELEGFRPHSQAAFNAEVKEAMARGWIDPRHGLQLLDLGRGLQGAYESETRHYARARRENLAIERGEVQIVEAPEASPLAGFPALIHPEDGSPFLLPEDDDHEVHIRVHQEILLDDTKPWPTRQAMALHIAEHRQILRLQAAAVAAPALADGQPNEEPR